MIGGTQHWYIQAMERRKSCLLPVLSVTFPERDHRITADILVKGSTESVKCSRCAGLATSKLLAHINMGLWLAAFPFLIFGPSHKYFRQIFYAVAQTLSGNSSETSHKVPEAFPNSHVFIPYLLHCSGQLLRLSPSSSLDGHQTVPMITSSYGNVWGKVSLYSCICHRLFSLYLVAIILGGMTVGENDIFLNLL